MSADFKPQGPLVQATVPAFHKEALTLAQDGGLRVDLVGVSDVDSSALALLIALRRQADLGQKPLEVIHVPETLRTLARLYNVEFVLDNQVR